MNKGEKTRLDIIEKSRELFNQKGCQLTIAQISRSIGHSKSKLTNHFPQKDYLIFAILQIYERELGGLIKQFAEFENSYTFQNHIGLLSDIMDLMFEYRGVIVYSLTAPKQSETMLLAVRGRYATNMERLKTRIERMVEKGLLKESILEVEALNVFELQYMNMLTTWFMTLELYHGSENFASKKPELIKAIVGTFSPYLSQKGKEELELSLSSLEESKRSKHQA